MSEKDLLDLLADEDEDLEDDDPNSVDELKEMIEELKKEKQGLLSAKQDEKRKRQEHQRRLEAIEDRLGTILDTKKAANVVDDLAPKGKGVTVDFTEDGTPYVPQEKLDELLAPAREKISQLEKALATTSASSQAALRADKIVRDALSEDERYPAVYKKYQQARDWINQRVVDYQSDNQLTGLMTPGEALDTVITPALEKQFKEEFDGMDLESVVFAEESAKMFRRMLSSHVDDDSQGKDDLTRFKKVLQKPSGLVNSPKSTKGADLSVMDKLADLSTDDIMELSDAKVKALEEALRREEVEGR